MAKSYYVPKKETSYMPYAVIILAMLAAEYFGREAVMLFAFLVLMAIYAANKYDSRIPVGFALILLAVSAFALVFKIEAANKIAIYAYHYLASGVMLQLFEYLTDAGEYDR